MAVSVPYNMVKQTVSAVAGSGLGDLTLSTAVAGYGTFDNAGVPNAAVVTVRISEGSDFEIVQGVYTSSGATFARNTVRLSKSGSTFGTSKVAFTTAAVVQIVTAAEDLLAISSAGKQTMVLLPGTFRIPASGGATRTSYNDVDALSFDGFTLNRVRLGLPFPKGWDNGTVTYQVFGVVDTGGTSGQLASFFMAGKAFSHDDPAWTTTTLSTGAVEVNPTITAAGNDDILVSSESAAITIDGSPQDGDYILIDFWRDPTDASDNSTTPFLVLAVFLHYTTNSATDA